MTVLTPPEHEHSAAVDLAAQWLASEEPNRTYRPAVPILRARFGLTAQEACQAIRAAQEIRARSM